MKTDKKIYPLSPSQDVPYLQCKYTLFKRVINILTSVTLDEDIDFDLMTKAYNLLIERHDSLRIKFFKKKKELMQYFDDAKPVNNIPYIQFKTAKEQEKFIAKTRKKGIKFLKGKVIEPYFIKTFDGKNMIFFKVCHLVLDIYGINVIFKDLLAIYNSLKAGAPLPEPPTSFEEVVKKDLNRKFNKEIANKNRKFFTDLLNTNPEPYYAGLHGPNNKIWQKKLAKGNRGMQMFFIQNDTKDYCHKIDASLVKKVIEYCNANEYSPATFLLYTCNLTAAMINDKTTNLLPLALYNCRGSALEKNCAGSKVQSVACYTKIDYKKPFNENFNVFSAQQFNLHRHLGFPDREFEMLLHKTYRSSWLETYYSLTFSFIPFDMPKGIKFKIYSNEKCALPAYLAQLYDVNTGEIDMFYDVQTKIISENDVEIFHKKYLSIIDQVIDNPQIKVGDISI